MENVLTGGTIVLLEISHASFTELWLGLQEDGSGFSKGYFALD